MPPQDEGMIAPDPVLQETAKKELNDVMPTPDTEAPKKEIVGRVMTRGGMVEVKRPADPYKDLKNAVMHFADYLDHFSDALVFGQRYPDEAKKVAEKFIAENFK